MKKNLVKLEISASQRITDQISELADWRGELLARLRKLILDVVPDISEEWKWGTAVWSLSGNVVAAGVFKDHVKLNFFKGASLKDPHRLFNSGLDAKGSRAINFNESDQLNEPALKALVRSAADFNRTSAG